MKKNKTKSLTSKTHSIKIVDEDGNEVMTPEEELKIDVAQQEEDKRLERARAEVRFESVEYNRLNSAPLVYGMESYQSYHGHGIEPTGMVQNQNNNILCTWNQKEINFWNPDTGRMQDELRVSNLDHCGHTTVSVVTFSHKYRLYLIITADCKCYFLNEHVKVVQVMDMQQGRLVNCAEFNHPTEGKKDGEAPKDQLILAGVEGVSVYDFVYTGKYTPERAAGIDKAGKNIKLRLENRQVYEKTDELCLWAKGLRIDAKN